MYERFGRWVGGGRTGVRVEIAGGAAEDEVALGIAFPSLDQREITRNGFLHDVVTALGGWVGELLGR